MKPPTRLVARGDVPRPVNVSDAMGTQGEWFGRGGEGSPIHSVCLRQKLTQGFAFSSSLPLPSLWLS